jgi:glycosyltransferase involved in cell wall biosynthesis
MTSERAFNRAEPRRVLALTPHPVKCPAPRYRVIQFIEPLKSHGIHVDLQSFTRPEEYDYLFESGHAARKIRWLVEGTLRRAAELARARRYDAILIQVWVHPMTFPPFDLALRGLRVPIVYDIDDAYYLPTGRGLDRLRDPGWLPRIMAMAHTIIAGSDFIGEFCSRHNPRVHVIPTAIDTDRFAPRPPDARLCPVIGWIGTHSTFQFVERLFPVFQELARDHSFILRLVSDGRPVSIPGVTVESVAWKLEQEVDYFRDLDVGLYPLADGVAAQAKHGFKLHQYMAVGVPAVVSDIGVNGKLVQSGQNAFLARTPEDWRSALSKLILDPALRHRMGRRAREDLDDSFSVRMATPRLAGILREASGEVADPARRSYPAPRSR